jgi:hypothetical protein
MPVMLDEDDPLWERLHDEPEPMWVRRKAAIEHQDELRRRSWWRRLLHWFVFRWCPECIDWDERP